MPELPDPVSGLRFRPAARDDAPGLHELMLACYDVDDAQERETLEDVEELFATPWWEPGTDAVVGVDDEGRVRAHGQVLRRPGQLRTRQALLFGGVHPLHRGRGVRRSVLAWQCARAEQVLLAADAEAGVPRMMRAFVEDQMPGRARLLRAEGFAPARFSATMGRDLAVPPPAAPLPSDVHVVALPPRMDDLQERVRRAHVEAFADHWGSEPIEPDDWRRSCVEGPGARPDLSFAALDEAGQVVGYLVSGTYPQDWEPQGCSEGWTNLLGVDRRRRGEGLARALLVRAMAAYAAAGLDRAGLAVDVDNPRALSLYTGLGYTERGRETSWVRHVSAP